jgi:hypothetical protein
LDDDNLPADGAVQPQPAPAAPAAQKPAQAQAQPPATQQAPAVAAAPAPVPAAAQAPQQTRNRLTAKQLSAIWAISRKLGQDQHGVRANVKARFNVQPEFLSRTQASELIGELSKQAGNGHGQEFEQAPSAGA